MNILITRTTVNEQTTDGCLYIDGQHVCDTAEATPTLLPKGTYSVVLFRCKKSKRKIAAVCSDGDKPPCEEQCRVCEATAKRIEKLRKAEYYQLEKALKAQDNDNAADAEALKTYEKQVTEHTMAKIKEATKKRTPCPRITDGNGVWNTDDGKIVVGRYLLNGCVKHSGDIFERLYERMEKALSRGHEVNINIR